MTATFGTKLKTIVLRFLTINLVALITFTLLIFVSTLGMIITSCKLVKSPDFKLFSLVTGLVSIILLILYYKLKLSTYIENKIYNTIKIFSGVIAIIMLILNSWMDIGLGIDFFSIDQTILDSVVQGIGAGNIILFFLMVNIN